ncbi:hypothetical protein ACN6LL_003032 [Streptomyces violaceoruber]
MPEDVGGTPFPDGREPDDDHDRGVSDEEFASVVFDEAFVRAAAVHEPTAVERLLAAAVVQEQARRTDVVLSHLRRERGAHSCGGELDQVRQGTAPPPQAFVGPTVRVRHVFVGVEHPFARDGDQQVVQGGWDVETHPTRSGRSALAGVCSA